MHEEKQELAVGESIRQGDVLLTRLPDGEIAKNACYRSDGTGLYDMSGYATHSYNMGPKGVFPEGRANHIVLALGEKSGSKHEINCAHGEVEVFGPYKNHVVPTHLRVNPGVTVAGVFLAHNTSDGSKGHGRTNIPAGDYGVRSQADSRGPIGQRTGGYGD